MDRATFHRPADTKAAITAAGHTLGYHIFQPMPQLNDIEHKWAEAKAYDAKRGYRSMKSSQVRTEIKIESSGYAFARRRLRAYGKSIPRDKIKRKVGQIIKALEPSPTLIELITALFKDICNQRVK